MTTMIDNSAPARLARRLIAAGRRARAFAACAGGTSAVELALIAPVLLVLSLVMFDVGRAYLEVQSKASSASAGAQLAVQDPDAELNDIVLRVLLVQEPGVALADITITDTSYMTTGAVPTLVEARELTVAGRDIEVTAVEYCLCPGDSGVALARDCGTLVDPCPLADPSDPLDPKVWYIDVQTGDTYNSMFSGLRLGVFENLIPADLPIRSSSTVRVR